MVSSPYDFVKITDLTKLSSLNNLTIKDISDDSYIVIAYAGHNYSVSTKEFIDIFQNDLININAKIDYLVDNSLSYARNADSRFNIASDEKSIAYKLTFLDSSKTLTDDEVMELFNKIIKEVESKFHAKVRDN